MKKVCVIFGGNFDPIHYGHIYISEILSKKNCINKIIFLPNNNPPHREKTQTSILDRINMIKLVIKNNALCEVSYLETNQNHTCYTIDTLKKIRLKIGFSQPLCFLIGEDNLQNLHLWKNWKEILLYSHLLISPRIHIKHQNYQLKNWINSHRITDFNLLYQKSFGLIFFLNIHTINISSSQIRKNYFEGKKSCKLLPPIVHKYILSNKIYINEK